MKTLAIQYTIQLVSASLPVNIINEFMCFLN